MVMEVLEELSFSMQLMDSLSLMISIPRAEGAK